MDDGPKNLALKGCKSWQRKPARRAKKPAFGSLRPKKPGGARATRRYAAGVRLEHVARLRVMTGPHRLRAMRDFPRAAHPYSREELHDARAISSCRMSTRSAERAGLRWLNPEATASSTTCSGSAELSDEHCINTAAGLGNESRNRPRYGLQGCAR